MLYSRFFWLSCFAEVLLVDGIMRSWTSDLRNKGFYPCSKPDENSILEHKVGWKDLKADNGTAGPMGCCSHRKWVFLCKRKASMNILVWRFEVVGIRGYITVTQWQPISTWELTPRSGPGPKQYALQWNQSGTQNLMPASFQSCWSHRKLLFFVFFVIQVLVWLYGPTHHPSILISHSLVQFSVTMHPNAQIASDSRTKRKTDPLTDPLRLFSHLDHREVHLAQHDHLFSQAAIKMVRSFLPKRHYRGKVVLEGLKTKTMQTRVLGVQRLLFFQPVNERTR